MILTPEKAIKLGLLKESEFSQKSPVGLDLSICKITEIKGGNIYKRGVSISPYEEVYLDTTEPKGWWLNAGKVYSLTFNEFVSLDNKHTAFIQHRSSLQRSGCIVSSGIFDPGFKSQLGATLFCFITTFIELNSRLAQIIIHENYPAKLYDGNYQGNKDLK